MAHEEACPPLVLPVSGPSGPANKQEKWQQQVSFLMISGYETFTLPFLTGDWTWELLHTNKILYYWAQALPKVADGADLLLDLLCILFFFHYHYSYHPLCKYAIIFTLLCIQGDSWLSKIIITTDTPGMQGKKDSDFHKVTQTDSGPIGDF